MPDTVWVFGIVLPSQSLWFCGEDIEHNQMCDSKRNVMSISINRIFLEAYD